MRRTQSMLVRDVVNRNVTTVSPDATLAQCARRMRDDHVGSVVVIENNRPLGVVTDRDIVLEAVAQSIDATTVTAREVIARSLASVAEDEDIVDALAHMREHGVRRLPVIGAGGGLAGIVALDDLLAVLAEQFTAAVDVYAAERTREGETRPAR